MHYVFGKVKTLIIPLTLTINPSINDQWIVTATLTKKKKKLLVKGYREKNA